MRALQTYCNKGGTPQVHSQLIKPELLPGDIGFPSIEKTGVHAVPP